MCSAPSRVPSRSLIRLIRRPSFAAGRSSNLLLRCLHQPVTQSPPSRGAAPRRQRLTSRRHPGCQRHPAAHAERRINQRSRRRRRCSACRSTPAAPVTHARAGAGGRTPHVHVPQAQEHPCVLVCDRRRRHHRRLRHCGQSGLVLCAANEARLCGPRELSARKARCIALQRSAHHRRSRQEKAGQARVRRPLSTACARTR